MHEDTEVGILAGARHGSTRFSTHFYDNSDDVDRARAGLDLVLQ